MARASRELTGSAVTRALTTLRSRLALRIYLVGLVQFSLVAVGLVLVAWEGRRSDPSIETLHVIADSIAVSPDDDALVASTLANAEQVLHTSLAVYDERHRLVAGTPLTSPPPPPPEPHRATPPDDAPPWIARDSFPPPPFEGPPPGPPPDSPILHVPFAGPPHPPPHIGHLAVPISIGDGRVWHLVVTAAHPLASALRGVGVTVALVLLVVGVSSWLTARSLLKPLARLSAATQAFGGGDLSARAEVTRHDELGDVALAFNQMAERVTLALRAEKELLANISHELRTPLQRIHIAIDLAAEGDADTARESLAEIAEDLGELEKIVEEVLAAARLSLRRGDGEASALPKIHLAVVDMAELLEKSETRFRSLHPDRELRVEVRGKLPLLEVDAVLMHRAFDNLLDNAHKYTSDPRGAVTLVAFQAQQLLVIEVRDRGIGIDSEDLTRLFEPFFRADRSRARTSGGLGLGLALAKRIVGAHGGTLGVESVLSEGTTVRIELPVRDPPA